MEGFAKEVCKWLPLGAHPDGEVSDAPLVPSVLAQGHGTSGRPRLWLADRQYRDLVQTEQFTAEDGHFVIRWNAKVKFHRDYSRPIKTGVNEERLTYREEWGWLGSPRDARRRYIRRITLVRLGAEDVVLVTDLLDENKYPATDLLALYLMRWGSNACFSVSLKYFTCGS